MKENNQKNTSTKIPYNPTFRIPINPASRIPINPASKIASNSNNFIENFTKPKNIETDWKKWGFTKPV